MNYFLPYRSFILTAVLTLGLLCAQQNVRAQDEEVVDTTAVAPPVEEEEPVLAHDKPSIPDPLVFRKVPDSVTEQLKKEKAFAYANDPAYWVTNTENTEEHKDGFWDKFYRFFRSTTVRYIVYALLIAFFIFIIYRIIVVNKLFLFYSSKKLNVSDTTDDAGIEDENLDEKIQKAIDADDHRMAVRFMYLKTLRLLNDRQWIRFHAEATNHEYVNQMSGNRLAPDFRFLTRVYDYVWYGEFPITGEQFEIVHNNFRNIYKAINS